jgi:membrane-associated phospholipid phosphatase
MMAYENFWVFVTLIGDPRLWASVVIALTALYFAMGKGKASGNTGKRRDLIKKFLLLMIPALLVSFLGSEFMKLVFQIPRPCMPCPAPGCNPYCPQTFSFPSAHTSTMTGIATAFYLLMRKRRYLLIYIFPLIIAASRVELGVHTVTDVAAGFIFGLIVTLLVWRYRKRIYKWEDEIL